MCGRDGDAGLKHVGTGVDGDFLANSLLSGAVFPAAFPEFPADRLRLPVP